MAVKLPGWLFNCSHRTMGSAFREDLLVQSAVQPKNPNLLPALKNTKFTGRTVDGVGMLRYACTIANLEELNFGVLLSFCAVIVDESR